MALNTLVCVILGSVLGVIVCIALGWLIYSQCCGKKKKQKSYRSLPTLEGGQVPEPEIWDEAAPLVQVSVDARTGQMCYELAHMKTKSAQPAADVVKPPQNGIAGQICLQTVRPLPPPSLAAYAVQYPATYFPARPSRTHVGTVPFASFDVQSGVQPPLQAGKRSFLNCGGTSIILPSSNYPVSSGIAEGVTQYVLPHRQAMEVGPKLQEAIDRTHETGKYRLLAGARVRQLQGSLHSSVNNLLSSQATLDLTWPEKLHKVEDISSRAQLNDSKRRISERHTKSGADDAKRIQESRTPMSFRSHQDLALAQGRKKSTEAARPRGGSPTRARTPPRKGSPPRTRSPTPSKPE